MGRNRTWLILGMTAAVVLAAAWWFFRPAPPANLLLACAPTAPTARTESSPTTPRLRKGSRTAPTDEAAGAPQPDQPFIDDDPAMEQQPLWTPDYGPAILGSRSQLRLHLKDSLGAMLDGDVRVNVRLTRLMGRYGLVSSGWQFDPSSGEFSGGGPDGFGLEPGEYEFFADAGPYGSVTRRYHIGTGQVIDEEIATPRYRRIICLQFEDREGKAITVLPDAPAYQGEEPAVVPTEYPAPAAVLRERKVCTDPCDGPVIDQSAKDECGEVRDLRYFDRKMLIDLIDVRIVVQKYLTDGGRYYVRVFSGGAGRVEIPLPEDWFAGGNIQLCGNFEGPEWDNYRVTLDPAAGYLEQVAERAEANTDDPGYRSLLQPRTTAAVAPFDPNDASDVGASAVRLVVRVNAPAPVHAWLENTPDEDSLKQAPAGRFNLYWNEEHRVWWTDMIGGMAFTVVLSDGMFLRHRQDVPALAEGQKKVEVTINLSGHALQFVAPPPTVAALATRCSAWPVGGGAEGASMMASGGCAQSYLCGDLPEKICGAGRFCLGPQDQYTGVPFTFALDADQRAQLASGSASCKVASPGLVLRAVGPDLGGLPSVWGALIDTELDEAARRVRKAQLNKTAVEGKAAREFLVAQQAWYLTEDGPRGGRIASDAHGYMYFGGALTPGKRYVLYLWSNSRDELRPDRRIDFVAGQGITDLGAVTLPSYTD